MLRDLLRRMRRLATDPVHERILAELQVMQRRHYALTVMQREIFMRQLLADHRYDNPKRLTRFGHKVYSQYDEDGIIAEIFARIGTTNRTFVEFGVEDGLENNTLKLLLEGWRGLWLEGSARNVTSIETRFADIIREGRLSARSAFVDRDNINGLIGDVFTGEIDLLSIDIDGNDIWILEALTVVRPRVIVIEYNGKFPPPMSIAQAYNAKHEWKGGDYGGSSLSAIQKVAQRKGYALVGCSFVGVNAFLVRDDLLGDHFDAPFTAEHHFEPARYYLWQLFPSGHAPDTGPYVTI